VSLKFCCFDLNFNSFIFSGRTIRVNIAKPQRIKENSIKPVWAEDTWLQKYAGQTLNNEEEEGGGGATEEGKSSENVESVTVSEETSKSTSLFRHQNWQQRCRSYRHAAQI
jgi:hypothetical protein